MGRLKTQEMWLNDLSGIQDGNFISLDNYINSSTKIRIKHITCGSEYYVTPNSFMSRGGCLGCQKQKTRIRTSSDWVKFMSDISGITCLTTWTSAQDKLLFKHLTCGETFMKTPSNFKKIPSCPFCSKKAADDNQRTSESSWNEWFDNNLSDEYELLDPYTGVHNKMRVKHKVCGKIRNSTPHDIRRINKCLCQKRKTDMEWRTQVRDNTNGTYEAVDTYLGDSEKIHIKHLECGNIYMTTPNRFLNGHRCSICAFSNGEKLVYEILMGMGIEFIPQKRFDGLVGDRLPLSFDLYIPSHNLLIEYQGQQHYKPVDIFGGEKSFIKQQKHDDMKRAYASDNGFNLLEIPYSSGTYQEVKSKLKNYFVKQGDSNQNKSSRYSLSPLTK